MSDRKQVVRAFGYLFLAALVAVIGAVAYAASVRASAQALIDGALQMRSAADVEQQVESWSRQRHFSEFTSPDGRERGYQVEARTGWLSTAHLVPSTGIFLQVDTHSNVLRGVLLGMYTEDSSVWIQREFEPADSSAWLQRDGTGAPVKAVLMLGPAADDTTIRKAFALNAGCMVKLGGCRNVEEMLPDISQLNDAIGPREPLSAPRLTGR